MYCCWEKKRRGYMNLDKILFDMYDETCRLHEQGRDAEAIFCCEKVAVQALNALGLAYCTYLKNYEQALSCFNDALKIDKSNWLLHSNICHVNGLQEKYEESLKAINDSLKFSEGQVFDPYYNAGVTLTALNRTKEAADMYRMALQCNPEHANASYNLGLCLLRLGNYKEGWDLYQYRFKTNELVKRFKERFLQPHWDGRKLKNKTLFVYSEQGLGDFIFYARFLPMVKNLGAKIIVEAQERVAPVVGDNLKIDKLLTRNDDLTWEKNNETDYCISVCDLPRVLKIDSEKKIPSDPYMFAPKKAKPKNFSDKKFKIGICWCGNPTHPRDHTRSMFLEQFRPLAAHKNVQLYGLMKGVSENRMWPNGYFNLNQGIETFPMINLESQINDFKDLAHFINHLDLVVTIDSGVAHLAGSMGKPVWILLGTETDWRWGDENTTPWYPTAKLFRKKDTWENLIAEVVSQLPS